MNDARRAGTHARERYREGLRSYRRRVRPYVVGLAAVSLALILTASVVWDLSPWAVSLVLLAGGLLALAIALRDEPPDFVERWRRGAAGERRTERALQLLVDEGWRVRHDREVDGVGNVDHIVLSPSGNAYVIDTKTFAGLISVEHGILTQRFEDDVRPRRHDQLGGRMRAQADSVAREWQRRSGRPAPAVTSIVAIWGAFDEQSAEHGGVHYVAGPNLVESLRLLDARRSRGE